MSNRDKGDKIMERIHELVLTPIEGFEQTFMILDSGLYDYIEAHLPQCVKIVDKTTGEVYEKVNNVVNKKGYAIQEAKFCYDMENNKLMSQDTTFWTLSDLTREIEKFKNVYKATLIERKDDVCATLTYASEGFYHIVVLSKIEADEDIIEREVKE